MIFYFKLIYYLASELSYLAWLLESFHSSHMCKPPKIWFYHIIFSRIGTTPTFSLMMMISFLISSCLVWPLINHSTLKSHCHNINLMFMLEYSRPTICFIQHSRQVFINVWSNFLLIWVIHFKHPGVTSKLLT